MRSNYIVGGEFVPWLSWMDRTKARRDAKDCKLPVIYHIKWKSDDTLRSLDKEKDNGKG